MKNGIIFLCLFHMKFRKHAVLGIFINSIKKDNSCNKQYIIYQFSSSVSYRPLLDYIITLRTDLPYFTY